MPTVVEWDDEYTRLSTAERQGSLEAEDLNRLGLAAFLTGRVDTAVDAWERTHSAFVERGDVAQGVRSAFWQR